MTAYDHPLDGHTTHGPWCEAVTGADVPPLAQEAMAAAEAAWIQATVQQPGCEAIAHEAWQAGWAARGKYDRDLLAEAADALWESSKAALVVKPNLDVPYPDDPRWTPWTRWVEPKARRAHDVAMRIRSLLRQGAGHD